MDWDLSRQAGIPHVCGLRANNPGGQWQRAFFVTQSKGPNPAKKRNKVNYQKGDPKSAEEVQYIGSLLKVL